MSAVVYEMRKEPLASGTYTQVPNVFLDTCDLPEMAQIFYLRLYRHVHYKGCKFTGSIRMLANLVRLSKSTVDRTVKRLEKSKLITVEYEQGAETKTRIMTITILKDELWGLNKQHDIQPVPSWDSTLPECINLGQSNEFMGQSVPPEGQDVPSEGQSVPVPSSKTGTNNINKLKEREEIKKPHYFENENNEDSQTDQQPLPFSLNADITKLTSGYFEPEKSSDVRAEVRQIFNDGLPNTDIATFRIKYNDVKEETGRATLEQIWNLGYSDRSSYFLDCLRKRCKPARRRISA